MAQWLMTFNAASAESPEDSTTQLKAGNHQLSLICDGVKRTYYLHVPTTYNPDHAVPLVLNFHGNGSSGLQQSWLTGMNKLADQNDFIVVYPDGLMRHWNDGRPAMVKLFDDMAFVRQLIKTLSSQFHIDSKRIYATGMSNGAFLSQALALEMPDTFAACAMVCSVLPKDRLSQTGGQPIPVIYFLGTKDPIVPFAGGQISKRPACPLASASETIEFWVHHNKCGTTPAKTTVSTNDNGPCLVTRDIYSAQAKRDDVIYYQVDGGGHTWPGGPQFAPVFIVGVACQSVNASDEIWKFFSTHPKD
jgi:polyhydroxybutyrate depolymerase